MIRLLPVLILCAACGPSTADTVRMALNHSARGLVAADKAFAPAYEEARRRNRAEASSWEELDSMNRPWEAARDALGASKHVMIATEAALDTAESDWIGQAACLAKSLLHLRAALRSVGVAPPTLLIRAESAINGLAVRCDRRMSFGPGREAEGSHDGT